MAGQQRETWDVAGNIVRCIRSVAVRVGDEDPYGLRYLREIDEALTAAWRTAVDGLRELGFTDEEIGDCLGVTKQAVGQRWPRIRTLA